MIRFTKTLKFIEGLKDLKVTQFGCPEFQVSFVDTPDKSDRQIGFHTADEDSVEDDSDDE